MVGEKRTEGDIQVTQSGIPICSGQDVLTRENYRITVMDTLGVISVKLRAQRNIYS